MAHITLKNVTVEFPVLDDSSRSLRHFLVLKPLAETVRSKAMVGGVLTRSASGVRLVRALDDVSISVSEGDRIGLVGHNGSGKTTLLRIMSGIFEPTGGTVESSGETMPLFNLSEGMSPDANGLELIRIRGYLMGLGDRQIDALEKDVIDFCELGDFIELPIRTYSSGMMMRLSFAIATAMTPEILLMDEVIGVADATFVERVQDRLTDFVQRSRIMVVATHSNDIIRQWCNRAILMIGGRVAMDGDVEAVLKRFAESPH